MRGELVPDRRGLRASHEDRDEAVERLRVAAGDGRLTADELDQRLEKALTARTYGELEALLADLPAGAGFATPPKDLVQVRATGAAVERVGPWSVPRRMEVDVRGGNVVLDFTQAATAAPTLELAVAVVGGNLKLTTPPGVLVDVDSIAMTGGNVRRRAEHPPGTPVRLMITLTGSVRGGNVIIRSPAPARPPGGRWRRFLALLLRR